MDRVCAALLLFLALIGFPATAGAAIEPEADPTIIEGLKDKGVDWLKDKAKDAGKDWIFDTGQSATMHDILLAARERTDGEGNDKAGLCQGAVMGKASSILNTINTKWTVKTAGLLAFETAAKMASLASGFGAAAGEGSALNWLAEQYADAAKDQGKDAVFDKIKKLFGDDKKPQFELFEESGKDGDCDYTIRAAWDIVHGTYRVYIAGDCHCKEVGNVGVAPRKLGKWWISFEGHLKLNVDKAKKTTSWTVLPVSKMDFDAQCNCSKRELREAFTTPGKGFVPAAPGTTAPPPPKGPGPLPPAGRKVCKECQKIQDEIDALTKTLAERKERISDLAGELFGANAKLESDKAKLAGVKANPKDYDITPEAVQKQVEADEATVKKIKAEGNKALNDQIRIEAQLRDLATQLEECLKKKCPCPADGQKEGAPPPAKSGSSGVSYEQDPFAARLLELHNSERAAVGAPPLQWNGTLAEHAQQYANELARTGQLAHAPREGRTERENVSQGRGGWSADKLARNWIAEKRNFVAGTFPNVSRTGNWYDVGHYSQIIWPTTVAVGCGMASGRGGSWLVCRYSPGGNRDGRPVGVPVQPEGRTDCPSVAGLDQLRPHRLSASVLAPFDLVAAP